MNARLLATSALLGAFAACSSSVTPPNPDAGMLLPAGAVEGQLTVFAAGSASAQRVSTRISDAPPPPPSALLRAVSAAWITPAPTPGFPPPAGLSPAVPPPLTISRGELLLPGEVLVRLDTPAVDATGALTGLEIEGLTVSALEPVSRFVHHLRYRHADGRALTADETRALLPLLSSRPGVRAVAPNRRVFPTALPNDQYVGLQWHYPAMNLPTAWDVRTDAAAVVVAVLDTGGLPHPDLTGVILPSMDLISDPTSAGDGDGRDGSALDEGGDLPRGASSWHGTHVAGTVGAVGNNRIGVSGVAWSARILPIRVLGRGGGTSADILAGIEWAVGEQVPGLQVNTNPARVLNLSLGADGVADGVTQDVIDRAVARGAIIAVAAGNEGENTREKFPCNQQNVICVGATRFSATRASYSNFGAEVDVMAPGGEASEDANADGYPDGVLSTHADSSGQPTYGFQQGTSMATPHVAGLLALMKTARPSLTHAQAEAILRDTASGAGRCSEGCGAGLVNAQAALLAAQGQAPTGPGRLVLPTTSILLEGSQTSRLTLANGGGTALEVTASFTPRTGGAAVIFPEGPTLSLPPGGSASLALQASVSGLEAGSYDGVLTLAPTGASAQSVAVRIRVGGAGSDGKSAVLAVMFEDEAGEWQLAGGAIVEAQNDYRFRVEELPPGEYFVVAAIDEDGDDEFFEDGERYGFYPNADSPEAIVVLPGSTTPNVDFALVPSTRVGTDPVLVIGAECGSDAECPGGSCDTSVPGGYCTLDCSVADCPAGSACYLFGEEAALCLAACNQPGAGRSSCIEGQVCYADDVGGGYCLTDCNRGLSCLPGSCSAEGYCE